MKIKQTLICLSALLSTAICAQQKDTLFVADFGAAPNTYQDAAKSIQNAVEACKRTGAKVLSFSKGRYDLWPADASKVEYFITNTSTESECPSKTKTVGLLLKEIKDLTIDGNGALLMFHGKMITLALEHCENITLKNIRFDFERPTMSEMRYTKSDSGEVEIALHRDSRYEIVDKRLQLYGEGWKSSRIHCVEYDPETQTGRYSQGWNVLSGSEAREIAPGMVRFTTPTDFRPKPGHVLTVRDVVRDQVGLFIYESRNITLSQVNMHYMHGLGIVSQYSRNITIDQISCSPRPESGRIMTSSADMMHFSGCAGKIKISHCRFEGAHDDMINIHGTNLRVVEKIDPQTVRLRFMHGQSYGFNAFFPGDEVAFVQAKTMERYAASQVTSVEKISEREINVRFNTPLPDGLEVGHDCVENMTWTPEVEVSHNYFTRTNTRGMLVTTPRKVRIENNTFYKTGMSAILIEGDAEGWFESGPVCDVLIRKNDFVDCGYQGGPGNAVIALSPSNTVIDADRPVHRNVRIEENTFRAFDYPILYAKSTADLLFKNNTVIRTYTFPPASENRNTIRLIGCKNARIEGTRYEGDVPGQNVKQE